MEPISQKLDAYSQALVPLRDAASCYLKHPSALGADGVMRIGHRPWVAELNYMFTLYPGIERAALLQYSQRFRIEVPEIYVSLLCEMNGAFCFGMSLCGVPRSMLANPPLLDRTILQCHDLATATMLWKSEYRVPGDYFHFGSRHFSSKANVGYFIDAGKRILSVKTNGKVVGEWSSFASFFVDELKTSAELEEKLHPWR
jgi:hypothetical protein